jgi:hypothetical protein
MIFKLLVLTGFCWAVVSPAVAEETASAQAVVEQPVSEGGNKGYLYGKPRSQEEIAKEEASKSHVTLPDEIMKLDAWIQEHMW